VLDDPQAFLQQTREELRRYPGARARRAEPKGPRGPRRPRAPDPRAAPPSALSVAERLRMRPGLRVALARVCCCGFANPNTRVSPNKALRPSPPAAPRPGVTGVPHFVIRLEGQPQPAARLGGAQPPEEFAEVFEAIARHARGGGAAKGGGGAAGAAPAGAACAMGGGGGGAC
jgi:hypothetical protein